MTTAGEDLEALRSFIAHDGPGFLNTINLHAAVLGMSYADGAESVDAIKQSVEQLQLRFTRLRAYLDDRKRDPTGSTDLASVCAEVDVPCTGAATIPLAPAGATRLIRELVDNARAQGDVVTVEGRETDAEVWITVADDGPGLPLARWDKALVLLSGDGRSAGVGLTWATYLVHAAGGRLVPEQREHGFTVSAVFPRQHQPAG